MDSYFDWEEEIEKKKNELKKTEFFLKINKIIEKLKSKNEKYNMFEKIKNQLLNNEIIVEKAFDKLYSLVLISNFFLYSLILFLISVIFFSLSFI